MTTATPEFGTWKARCLVCMKPLPEGAAVCTECESWQVAKRSVALLTKFALVLVVPFAAWIISVLYQKKEHEREAAQARISATIDQMSQVLDMVNQFQTAFDRLPTNCSKDGQTAANLCLSEYVDRLIGLNELTSRFVWKSTTLPLEPSAKVEVRKWQDMWWGSAGAPSAGGALKRAFAEMAKSGKLIECQKLDFTDSECGSRVQDIIHQFRDETLVVMCEIDLEMREHTLELYNSIPRNAATQKIEEKIQANQKDSYCSKVVQKSQTARAAVVRE